MRGKIFLIFGLILFTTSLSIAQKDSSYTDNRDGKIYKTVKIGTQTWMAENLYYQTTDSWCYNDSTANCTKYGRLYTWKAALKACPSGWHLPSDTEWAVLSNNSGGKFISGGNLKSVSSWAKPNTDATNSSGFSSLAGGFRSGDGKYGDVGYQGCWWSSAEIDTNYAWYRVMTNESSYLLKYNLFSKSFGVSVRCIKD